MKPLSVSLVLVFALAGCHIEIDVPEGGRVTTESGTHECLSGQTCVITVSDTNFDETFVAEADEDYVFAGWARDNRYFCGGSVQPCRLPTTGFGNDDNLLAVLNSDETFFLQPIFKKENQVRQIQPGEFIEYRGTLTTREGFGPSAQSNVSARLEYSRSAFELEGEAVFAERVTINHASTGTSATSTVHLYQDDDGSVHTLADEDGARYYSLDNNTYGLLALPSPLVPGTNGTTRYRLLNGTDTSQTRASGMQSVLVSDAEPVSVPLGSFSAYKVTTEDELEHVAPTAGYSIGDRLVAESVQWIVPHMDVVRIQLTLRRYDSSGNLATTRIIDMEATRTNIR